MATTRREFLKVAGGAAAAGTVGFPAVARAQAKPGVPSDPVKIGILAIRAGIAAPVGAAAAPPATLRNSRLVVAIVSSLVVES